MDELGIPAEVGSEVIESRGDKREDIRAGEESEQGIEFTEDSGDESVGVQQEIETLSDEEITAFQQEMASEQSVLSRSDENDDFAKMIDSMSLDELWDEREKLIELGALETEQSIVNEQSAEQVDSIIEGLSKDQLETLRSKLETTIQKYEQF